MIGYALYVIAAVVVLFGATIFAHELGHFIAARLCGMVVEVFSIGFGPALWRRKIRGIWYKIGALPLGGYVALPQMDPSDGASPEQADAAALKDKDAGEPPAPMPPTTPPRKIIVSLAGGAGNIVLAFLLAWAVYLMGKPSMPAERCAVIGFVESNSVAYAAGLRPGDEILSVNGRPVANWQDVLQENAMGDAAQMEVRTPTGNLSVALPTERSMLGFRIVPGLREISLCRVMAVEPESSAAQAGLRSGDLIVGFDGERVLSVEHLVTLVAARAGMPAALAVERDGAPVAMEVTPRLDPELGRARIGIRFDPMAVEYDKVVHIPPLTQLRAHATGIFRILRRLVTPREARGTAEGLGGPLMIIYMFQDMVRKGLVVALWFTCFLNVNLAILNLLPLPVLDGGHVMFALLEWVRGRPLSARALGWISQVFFFLFIALFVLLTWRDVQRVYRISRLFHPPAAEPAPANAPAAAPDETP